MLVFTVKLKDNKDSKDQKEKKVNEKKEVKTDVKVKTDKKNEEKKELVNGLVATQCLYTSNVAPDIDLEINLLISV